MRLFCAKSFSGLQSCAGKTRWLTGESGKESQMGDGGWIAVDLHGGGGGGGGVCITS